MPSLSSESGKNGAELADLAELTEPTGACPMAETENIEQMAINTRVLGFNIIKKLFPDDGEYGNILTGFSEAFSNQAFLKSPISFPSLHHFKVVSYGKEYSPH